MCVIEGCEEAFLAEAKDATVAAMGDAASGLFSWHGRQGWFSDEPVGSATVEERYPDILHSLEKPSLGCVCGTLVMLT